ncbi:hypothetical protein [Nocardia sp. NBC_01009]|uniref:hypothetical protein n=1 Tax=Nocardia sp. NBC_01009 TaxID=2975996 RepID=UPI0038663E66|nr:hypothetical protein OHA42_17935 [Nocardia sp. NBC_01009]
MVEFWKSVDRPFVSVSKAGLMVGGRDCVVKTLVNPMTLAQDAPLPPSAGGRNELGVAWHLTHQPLRLGAARQLAALQDIYGVLSDCHATVLVPEQRETGEICDDEEDKLGAV